jgi:hypothetical protein
MKKLIIDARDNTPSVFLDKETGKLEIRGYSFPDESYNFYSEIIEWFKEYIKDPNAETKMIFDFKYVNSTSSKYINDILKHLDSIAAGGKSASVEWLFEEEDEDIQQLGTTLKEFHQVPFSVSLKTIPKDSPKKRLFD